MVRTACRTTWIEFLTSLLVCAVGKLCMGAQMFRKMIQQQKANQNCTCTTCDSTVGQSFAASRHESMSFPGFVHNCMRPVSHPTSDSMKTNANVTRAEIHAAGRCSCTSRTRPRPLRHKISVVLCHNKSIFRCRHVPHREGLGPFVVLEFVFLPSIYFA